MADPCHSFPTLIPHFPAAKNSRIAISRWQDVLICSTPVIILMTTLDVFFGPPRKDDSVKSDDSFIVGTGGRSQFCFFLALVLCVCLSNIS